MTPNLKKAEYIFLITAALIGFSYILTNYGKLIVSVFLPFVISSVCAHFLSPPAEFLIKKAHFPGWAAHIFVVLTFYAALFTSAYILVSRLVRELSGLSEYARALRDSLPSYLERIGDIAQEKLGFLSFSSEGTRYVADGFAAFLSSVAEKLAAFASKILADIISFVPNFLIFSAVTVIATCYFSADLKRIKAFLLFQLPDRAKIFFSACRVQFFSTTSKYLGAYLALSALTFFELFSGLLLINRDYAFVLALVITFVDALPFIGCGIVLLPWSLAQWAFGNAKTAIALLILYAIIAIVRQIAEPKILGSFIGLYPLLTLFSVYAGAKLAGFFGIFLFPIAAITLKNLNEKGIVKLFKNPPENNKQQIMQTRAKYKKFRKLK